MLNLIVSIIFILSVGGVLFILSRKIPVLVTLPRNGKTGLRENRIVSEAEKMVVNFLSRFEKQKFLHKFLSWTKILILKIEARVDSNLHRIRRKAQESKK